MYVYIYVNIRFRKYAVIVAYDFTAAFFVIIFIITDLYTALCGSRPLVTPYYCRLGDLKCYILIS